MRLYYEGLVAEITGVSQEGTPRYEQQNEPISTNVSWLTQLLDGTKDKKVASGR